MRIALATSSYAPYIGGVEEHVRNVARVLRDRGHEVVVWTIDRDGGFGIRRVDGIEVWDLPAPLPARSITALARLAFALPRAAWLWRKAFRSFRPEVIHVHCFGPNGTYARVLSGRTRTPLVLTAHGETLADDEGVFVSSRFAQDSLRRTLAAADAVTGCSRVALDDLVDRFGLAPGRGEVVFNGIDVDEPAGDVPPGVAGRYIAAVARAQYLKGFDLLIDAFARAHVPAEVRLVIGGGGPEVEQLRDQAARLGVADRVVLTGWLDRPAVVALRRAAEIGVVPSRFEAFGIAVLEVWRAGTALVATTRGGPPEFLTDGVDGVLVDPEDVTELARVLSALVADPPAAARLAAAGRLRAEAFTWEATTDAYERLYRDVSVYSGEAGA